MYSQFPLYQRCHKDWGLIRMVSQHLSNRSSYRKRVQRKAAGKTSHRKKSNDLVDNAVNNNDNSKDSNGNPDNNNDNPDDNNGNPNDNNVCDNENAVNENIIAIETQVKSTGPDDDSDSLLLKRRRRPLRGVENTDMNATQEPKTGRSSKKTVAASSISRQLGVKN
jgi:hypothetical protein